MEETKTKFTEQDHKTILPTATTVVIERDKRKDTRNSYIMELLNEKTLQVPTTQVVLLKHFFFLTFEVLFKWFVPLSSNASPKSTS